MSFSTAALKLTPFLADIELDTIGTWSLVGILLAMVVIAVAVNVIPIFVPSLKTEYSSRDITYGAICLALGYSLSWFGFSMPLGGTVTPAALAPVFIYCYFFGFRKSTVIAAAYLLLQLTQGPYITTPWGAFFDYILPYFSLCVVGLFAYKPDKYASFLSKRPIDKTLDSRKAAFLRTVYRLGGHYKVFIGIVIFSLIRYASNVLSGMLFFYDAGITFEANLIYGLSYNSYGLVDSLIATVAVAALLLSKTFNALMTSAFHRTKNAVAGEENYQAAASATDERERESGGRNTTGDNGNVDENLNGNNGGNAGGKVRPE